MQRYWNKEMKQNLIISKPLDHPCYAPLSSQHDIPSRTKEHKATEKGGKKIEEYHSHLRPKEMEIQI